MIEKIDTSFDITLENLQSYLGFICSVVRDKDVNNNAKLWDRLMKESYGNKPSSVFSFIPCVLEAQAVLGILTYTSEKQFFGYFKEGKYYTNAREVLNWGSSVEAMLNVVDFKGYKAFKCKAPYFIYQQIRTHSQMQFLSHSARYTEANNGYWKPDGVTVEQCTWDAVVEQVSPKHLEELMKDFGVKRREVFGRSKDMLQIRSFAIGGSMINPNSFPHFLNERGLSNHTQLECRNFVNKLKMEII